MQINLTFDSWEEMQSFIRKASANGAETTRGIAEAVSEKPAEPQKPAATDAPTYTTTDAQKAVREAVKAAGKEAVKVLLSEYPSKDNPSEHAHSASTIRPEDYADVIPRLEAMTNA